MSHLALLHIKDFRNLIEVKANLSSRFNLLYGPNGSGKTSFLEAIYYLGLSRSFRSRLNSRIIHHQASSFSLFAQLMQEPGCSFSIGMERQSSGQGRTLLAQEKIKSIAEIAQILPILLLNSDSRFFLTGSSKLRRQFMDWGLFHVERNFFSCWQQMQRVLKQRNAALRAQTPVEMVRIWNRDLEKLAETLNTLRKGYIHAFEKVFLRMLDHFFEQKIDISLSYKSGWDDACSLTQVLEKSLSRDFQLGYTQYGPHRADLVLRVNGSIPAHEALSQGQQKLVIYALYLAQGILLKEQTEKACIYLLDDLPAELDAENRKRVVSVLNTIDAQVFVTAVDSEMFDEFKSYEGLKTFHVEQGSVQEAPCFA